MPRAQRASRVPRVIVLYGTTEGHSAKVADAVGETLRSEGLNVDVFDASRVQPPADPYDGAVIVASVHAGNYQTPVVDWARRHARTLNAMPSAFVSVCLGVLQDDPKVQQDLEDIRERFLTKTGWTPTATTAVAGALRYSRYNVLQRLMMKRVAAQAGGGTDTSRDYEYTDWSALAGFVGGFARRIRTP